MPVDTSVHNDLAVRYWEFLDSIFPNEVLDSFVTSLYLFSDGLDFHSVYVSVLNQNSNKYWEFSIDTFDVHYHWTDSAYTIYCYHNLIHEFGNILLNNDNQTDIAADYIQYDSLPYLTMKGKPLPNSYLNKFIEFFWMEEDLVFSWNYSWLKKNKQKRERFLSWFYYEYKHCYLTAYAAESPIKDIAESWTFFVLDEKPVLKGIKYDKIRFFYEFPELVKYREEIRSNLKYLPKDYLKNYSPERPSPYNEIMKLGEMPFKK